jgi:pullulanase
LTHANLPEQVRIDMHKQVMTAVLLSQSPSFFQAGTEFLRTKKGVENSFESPDSINAIDWNDKFRHQDVFSYVKQLVALKKKHTAFQLKEWNEKIRFYSNSTNGLLGYFIDARTTNDSYQQWQIWLNPSDQDIPIFLSNFSQEKGWKIMMKDYQFFDQLKSMPDKSDLILAPHQSLILVKTR